MKKVLAILLMLCTTTMFAGNGDLYRSIRLHQVVNVDGTTSPETASRGGFPASVEGVQLSTGELMIGAAALVVMAVGIGVGITNKDPTRGDGHLTHSSQRSQ